MVMKTLLNLFYRWLDSSVFVWTHWTPKNHHCNGSALSLLIETHDPTSSFPQCITINQCVSVYRLRASASKHQTLILTNSYCVCTMSYYNQCFSARLCRSGDVWTLGFMTSHLQAWCIRWGHDYEWAPCLRPCASMFEAESDLVTETTQGHPQSLGTWLKRKGRRKEQEPKIRHGGEQAELREQASIFISIAVFIASLQGVGWWGCGWLHGILLLLRSNVTDWIEHLRAVHTCEREWKREQIGGKLLSHVREWVVGVWGGGGCFD